MTKGLRVFVTGATGFVGANLVRLLLAEGYQVRALVRSQACLDNLEGLEVERVIGQLGDPALTGQLQGCQVLFHVAAHYSLWQRDRSQLYQSNVLGTQTLLESARAAGIERIVYTSSVAAIGVPGAGAIAKETYQSPVDQLIGDYKKSKYWAEQAAHQAVQAGQDIVIVNPSTPIGPWDIKPTPTGDIILRFLRRQMPAYLNTGLNLIHVQDVARGHLLALEKGKTGERYILGHQNMTLKQMLDLLAELTGLSAPQFQVPAWLPLIAAWVDEYVLAALGKQPSVPLAGVQMATQQMFYDASKAVTELGLPQTPIKIALQEAVDWFASHDYLPN
ncbi:MAG: NAD-dependent epimerase/dehydratase family protein [Acaryochloridaceae cyanobacterium SU_2_1]|nr:NAD-dependent epimerase/dehydratase family protein [Acaryochloridaceae cyanobacterium SU_2_1]NJM95502.1 NAD-dependent epimerase/dehydratase family protein [Acaryochloridaceae cyanobacterium CSU_5_19]